MRRQRVANPVERESESGSSRQRYHIAIAIVLLLSLGMRGFILLTGQRYLRSDEAVVGLMAKHIVARGETPVFLYGQPYGGGHALVAYAAAPLFALFGRSAILLTAVSAIASLASAWLLWNILRKYFSQMVALGAAALYAFSPPVVYQGFLVNGGAETFLLALIALAFFLKAYMDGKMTPANGLLTGIFSGLAYWGMDYALLYPVVFVFLWLLAGGARHWRWLAAMAGGFVVGCLPLALYNVTHDFVQMRHMFGSSGGADLGFLAHFGGALWGTVSGDLAAFFGGDIDNFKPVGPGAWLHAIAAIVAIPALLYSNRAAIVKRVNLRSLRAKSMSPLPAALLPVVFVLVYMAMYCTAKFSLPALRTPRYFLPLCPFISIGIALLVLSGRSWKARIAGWLLVALLVAHGAALSVRIGTRQWHDEHGIRTSGEAIEELAAYLREHDIRTAFAPYEIQWRLMFATDESVLATSRLVSPVDRYPWYTRQVGARVMRDGEPFAFIFRKDFAFAEWASNRRLGHVSRASWEAATRSSTLPIEGVPVGEEFVVYYPLTADFLRHLAPQ